MKKWISMKFVLIILMFGLIICIIGLAFCCIESDKYISKNVSEKNARVDELATNSKFLKFKNDAVALVEVEALDKETKIKINNVKYYEKFLNYKNKFDNFIIKENQSIETFVGQEGQNSLITAEIFKINSARKVSTIRINADALDIFASYYKTSKYGCCGAENYHELVSLWGNKTFLKYNSKYYCIDIPNTGIKLYFGFLVDSWDKKNLILGELYFAHSISKSVPGKAFVTHGFTTVNKVIFKTKDKALFNEILGFSPQITLLKSIKQDRLIEYQDHQTLTLWSFDKNDRLEGISFVALKLEFEGDKTISVEIPIKNGYLFGKANKFDQVVYLGE